MNSTIKTQLSHRSIRKFKNKPLEKDIVATLVDVARHTATSSFMQSYSIISVTDPEKKEKLAEIGKQPYIAESGHLFVMIADQHRNAQIALEDQADIDVLGSFDRFFVGATDAILAAQNIMIAAESMGLGGVFLGSLLNQADQVIELLELPEYTTPVLGIALGYPDQEPQLKPRLPQHLMHFENSYPEFASVHEALSEYDETVQEYYDLRATNNRIEAFTTQITKGMGRKHPGRMKLLEFIRKQKLLRF